MTPAMFWSWLASWLLLGFLFCGVLFLGGVPGAGMLACKFFAVAVACGVEASHRLPAGS